jgi:hypothetical protein
MEKSETVVSDFFLLFFLILKASGSTKVAEALRSDLVGSGSHLRPDHFKSLCDYLKEHRSPFSAYLAMILAYTLKQKSPRQCGTEARLLTQETI